MIKVLTAYTFEADEPDIAVREILEHLDIEHNVLKNTIGFIFCHADFIKSGIVEAIGEALPFELVGCTAMGIALPGVGGGEMILAVAVLTSDEVTFTTGLSEPLITEEEERIRKVYQDLSASLEGPPSMILTFQPRLNKLGGDLIVKILDRLFEGAPIFGTSALDVNVNPKLESPMTIYNGKAYADRLALLVLHGGVAPQFAIDSIGGQKTQSQKALITVTEGNRIVSINNMPAVTYMENIGLINNGDFDMLYAFPLSIDKHNGEKPNTCIILSINDDGSLICGSSVPAGSTLNIGSPSSEEVLRTAANITSWAKKEQGRALLFIFSCFSRSIALLESTEEINLIQNELEDADFPYIFLYSGGEICPVFNENDRQVNRYHNYAIISCLL
ncbi:MAG: FIST C-terminal domain-containing protein [Treponema sp.]|jgi:hypothetical protein|nr:FIST C-terminal domain-containing protein [Treponema sp.]